MNLMLMLDNKMNDLMYPLSPHFNIFDMEKPGGFGGNIEIPKPVIATMANWLRCG